MWQLEHERPTDYIIESILGLLQHNILITITPVSTLQAKPN